MPPASELDLGPLTWVKGEIDAALARAATALDEAGQGPDGASQALQFAQSHLHQVRGALSIVGLDGLTHFADSLDRLLGKLAHGDITFDPERARICHRALSALANYLDELAHGAPDQPLRLARLYGEITAQLGDKDATSADLFYPDLSRRPAHHARTAVAVPGDQEESVMRATRASYERGLLDWLRHPADGTGPRQMRDAAASLEAHIGAPAARLYWWVCTAFFNALEHGHATPAARQICTRIGAIMRHLPASAASVPDKLLRDTLYEVALVPAETPQQQAVHTLFGLDELIPEADASVNELPLAPMLRQLRELLGDAKESWNTFANGTAAALPEFNERLQKLEKAAQPLGRPAFTRLLDGLRHFANWLARDPLRCDDNVALEVATAMLLGENMLDTGSVPSAGISSQVAESLERLAALTQGKAPTGSVGAATTAAARKAQEREAMAQFGREILTSLNHVEQALDEFFRNPEERAPLENTTAPLHQIEGALQLLGEPAAIDLVREARSTIAGFAAASEAPSQESCEGLAHRLSALGFWVEALQRGPADLQQILEGRPLVPAAPPQPEVATEAEPFVQPVVEPHTAIAEAAPVAPAAPVLTAPLEIPAVARQAEAPVAPQEVVSEPATPATPAAPAPAPAQPPQEELDPELLEIFIEEAHEVIGTMREHLELSRQEPSNHEYFVTIRRGFHTLKGSGRMVGLHGLGEAAWGMEQTLNRWLQLEWTPTPAMHALIAQAVELFGNWVEQLAANGGTEMDASAMLALAEALRNTDKPVEELSQLVPVEATPAPTAEQAEPPAPVAPEPEVSRQEAVEPEILVIEAPAEVPAATEAPLAEAAAAPVLPEDEGFELDEISLEPLEETLPETRREGGDTAVELDEQAFAATSLEVPAEAFDAESLSPATEWALDEATPAPEAPPAMPPTATETTAAAEADTGTEAVGRPEAPVTAEPEAEAVPASMPDVTPPQPAEEEDVAIGELRLPRTLFELFTAEAQQHVQTLRNELAHLRANPTLLPDATSIRAAHTLAGISGTARIDAIAPLARALEHAQLRLEEAQTPPDAEQIALLETCGETLYAMVNEVCHNSMPLPVPELTAQLEELIHHTTAEAAREPASPAVAEEAVEPTAVPSAIAVPQTPPPASEAQPVPAPQDELDDQLLPIFLEEAADLMGQLSSTLRQWHGEPGSAEPPRLLARLLHTLKGSARMAGAMTLGAYVHGLEGQLEQGLKGTAPRDALIDAIEGGIDQCDDMIGRISRGEPVSLPQPVAPAVPPASTAAAPAPTATAIPAPAAEAVTPAVPAATAAPAAAQTPADAEHEAAATLRVRADTVDRFVNEAGEIGIARTRIEGELRTVRRSLLDLTENVIRLRNQLREVEIQAEVQMRSRQNQAENRNDEFDPLEMDRYTRLQELTRMMAESVGDVTTIQQNLLRNLDGAEFALNAQARMSRDLQQSLMRVRMVPFDSIADRLYRVVRQSAKDLGKRATLDIVGGQIEIDRGVLERMTSAFEHLLRNSVSHGIEDRAMRQAAGKDERGLITLSLHQEGNEIVIDLSDDGKGLDFERILARAREKGLVGATEQVDEHRLTSLIFLPGFSTATKVSAVAGRGVGMDVVKAETAAVGGRIDVSSHAGQGTLFRIYLPLTLAVTQALLVRAGGRDYAIPSSMIAQVMELKEAAIEEVRRSGEASWMERAYGYRYLPRLLGDNQSQPESGRINWLLLLHAGAQTLALEVDGLRGNQEIVVKKAGPQLARIVGVTGATVLGDGEIVLILNPVALATRGGVEAAASENIPIATAPVAPVQETPLIMVVDDSLTVRKITTRLLEREGYRVETAKDGVDALEKLVDQKPAVILSDIEMPRMDGFDLLRNIRADVRTRDVPVIMITSRLADKHRQYAEELGASHYLGKPFQEDELLELLAGYTGQALAHH